MKLILLCVGLVLTPKDIELNTQETNSINDVSCNSISEISTPVYDALTKQYEFGSVTDPKL